MQFKVEDWLAPSIVKWIDEEGGAAVEWSITVEWGVVDGNVECVGLSMRQADPPRRQVTATTLRRLKVGDVVRRARRERYASTGGDLVEAYRAAEAGDDEDRELLRAVPPSLVADLEKELSPWSRRGPGRPQEYDDEHFRRVARTYSDAVAAGLPPLQAVVMTEHVSQATASRWVARARELGMLPRTTPGKVGKPMSSVSGGTSG